MGNLPLKYSEKIQRIKVAGALSQTILDSGSIVKRKHFAQRVQRFHGWQNCLLDQQFGDVKVLLPGASGNLHTFPKFR